MNQVFHSARSAARAIGRPVSQILSAIRSGVVRPRRTSSTQLALTSNDVEVLRAYLATPIEVERMIVPLSNSTSL